MTTATREDTAPQRAERPARGSVPFGAALHALRTKYGLTQRMLAERAGYVPSYISRLESGDRVPTVSAVNVLARVMTATPEERDELMRAAGYVYRPDPDPEVEAFRALPPDVKRKLLDLVETIAHERDAA